MGNVKENLVLHQTDYYGFVYLWKDTEAKRYYVGSHYGALDGGYVGSNVWLRRAYRKRPTAFRRRILWYLTEPNKVLLLQKEQRWLEMIKPEELTTSRTVTTKTAKYYNMKRHAAGGNGSSNLGKSKRTWNKGTTKEMWDLRREGLFCLLIDRPKPPKKQDAPHPNIGRVPWNKGLKREKQKKIKRVRLIVNRPSGPFSSVFRISCGWCKKAVWASSPDRKSCSKQCAKEMCSKKSAENGRKGASKTAKARTGTKIVIIDGKRRYKIGGVTSAN